MFKEHSIVMLSTKKAVFPKCIWLGRISGELHLDYSYPEGKICDPIDHSMLPQNLYILSDETIKEGDWYYSLYHETILQCSHKNQAISLNILYGNNVNKGKVIATTDKSLKLPEPSEGFIKAFIKAYNSGNSITKVMVEYEYAKYMQNSYGCGCTEGFQELCANNIDGQDLCKIAIKLKLNSKNNTITIKKIKDSWSRDEVLKLVKSAYSTALEEAKDEMVNYFYFNNWIKQNL